MISVAGLRKSYGDLAVLDGVDLEVAEGTIFALLGPNGDGKSTIVHILSTLIGADEGDVRVAGHDLAREPDAVRAAIGLTGQFSAVDTLLTGRENLILIADLHHLGRLEGRRRADRAARPRPGARRGHARGAQAARERPSLDDVFLTLMGTPIGNSGVVALAWCAAIALSGYLWARDLYNRDPTP